MSRQAQGPLQGIKVIEIAGIGPAPFCTMLLTDLGADAIRIDRFRDAAAHEAETREDLLLRGRPSVRVNLKDPRGVDALLDMTSDADVLIEGFRPGVMERLGLGPQTCLERNPRLVYARMTGWGQSGPLAGAAGHDINYIALSGALHSIGERGGAPVPPLNLIGDFGGGALYLAFGICAALLERQRSGKGQVVDAAMVDGAASLMTMFYGWRAAGHWNDERGTNMLDGGLPWYSVYETSDHRYVAVGSLEPQFYAALLRGLDLDEGSLPARDDPANQAELRALLARTFKTKTSAEWCALLEGTDACFAPVLSIAQAPEHPHNHSRESFVEVDGIRQPAPAPRFSRTPGRIQCAPAEQDQDAADEALRQWGLAARQIADLRRAKVLE